MAQARCSRWLPFPLGTTCRYPVIEDEDVGGYSVLVLGPTAREEGLGRPGQGAL
jgi:hypothetical protein